MLLVKACGGKDTISCRANISHCVRRVSEQAPRHNSLDLKLFVYKQQPTHPQVMIVKLLTPRVVLRSGEFTVHGLRVDLE